MVPAANEGCVPCIAKVSDMWPVPAGASKVVSLLCASLPRARYHSGRSHPASSKDVTDTNTRYKVPTAQQKHSHSENYLDGTPAAEVHPSVH